MTLRARGPSYEREESLQDPLNPQHELMVTAVTGTNGKKFKVRCKCMAEYKNIDTTRYYNFDYIKIVDNFKEANRIYENHLRVSAILVAVAKFYHQQRGK